jgi:hypothetical protein
LRGSSSRTGNFLASGGVISGNGDGVLGIGSEVLGEIRFQKAEVHGEGL